MIHFYFPYLPWLSSNTEPRVHWFTKEVLLVNHLDILLKFETSEADSVWLLIDDWLNGL